MKRRPTTREHGKFGVCRAKVTVTASFKDCNHHSIFRIPGHYFPLYQSSDICSLMFLLFSRKLKRKGSGPSSYWFIFTQNTVAC
eukprot:g41355.t1